jgi:small subunit ribosomal protein S4
LKFEKPKERWNLERIKSDRALIKEYGLKNMKELWKVQSEVSRLRRNVRELLSLGAGADDIKEQIIGRLVRLGISAPTTTLDNLLDLKENDFLNRRLQTVVFRKGMARTMRQARQLTVHGFIAIDGRKVNKPSYLVNADIEHRISYYKPIDVAPPKMPVIQEPAQEEAESAPQVPQAATQESSGENVEANGDA